MDRSLDEIINSGPRNGPRSRPQNQTRGGGGGGGYRRGPARERDYDSAPRDGVKKYSQRDNNTKNIDSDWVHDKYDDEPDSRRAPRNPRSQYRRDSPSLERPLEAPTSAKLKVENLHYDIGEIELKELFARVGPIKSANMKYDRNDRSVGIAFVEYHHVEDARAALREFDGANAYGQPIRLQLLPPRDAAPARSGRNPFDNVEKPSRSLFERVESRDDAPNRRGDRGPRRARSASPGARLAPPEGVDRYVPGGRSRDSRSPMNRRGTTRESGRRPGAAREAGGRGGGGRGRGGGGEGGAPSGRRPKKTVDELDAEMNDYWGASGNAESAAPAQARGEQVETIPNGANQMTNATPAINADDDIDLMVE